MCNPMNDGYVFCTKSKIDSHSTCMSQFSMLSENYNWFDPEGSSVTCSVLYSASVGLEELFTSVVAKIVIVRHRQTRLYSEA